MEKRVGSAAAAHFLTKNNVQNMIDQINQQRAGQGQGPFQWKTIPQEAATSVWAAVVGPSDMIVRNDLPVAINEGVRGCAIDPNAAEALWKKSEEMVGESFLPIGVESNR
jgi:hypothetical protein